MKRRLFNLATVVSLVMCLAIAALWVRSYFVRDQVSFGTHSRIGAWTSLTGSTGVGWGPRRNVRMGAHGWTVLPPSIVVPEGRSWAGLLDIGVKRRGAATSVVLPHWVLMTICLVLPVQWLHRRRIRKHSAQHCPACGYDLRGGTGKGCPECGFRSTNGPTFSDDVASKADA